MNILAIDPGSTSTKVGVQRAGKLAKASVEHPRHELENFHGVMEQLDFRMEHLVSYLHETARLGGQKGKRQRSHQVPHHLRQFPVQPLPAPGRVKR